MRSQPTWLFALAPFLTAPAACLTEPPSSPDEPEASSAPLPDDSPPPERSRLASLSTSCSIIAAEAGPVTCVGSTRTYRVSHTLTNPTIRWSVASGGMSILGATTGASVTVQFHQGFASGQLLAELDEPPFLGVDCGVIAPIASQCMTPPPAPGSIAFDYFRPPEPQHGDFCTITQGNLLEAAASPCASSYSWTISPTAPGVKLTPNGRRATLSVFQARSYTVSVRASNCNGTSPATERILVAETCSAAGL